MLADHPGIGADLLAQLYRTLDQLLQRLDAPDPT